MTYPASSRETGLANRVRRSVLFVPGANERAIEKSRGSDADSIVLDLEDMVPPEQKLNARNTVLRAMASGAFGNKEVIVRTNGLDTVWGEDDIAAMASIGSAALLLPKIDSVAMLDEYLRVIDANGGAGTGVWILAETARGILAMDNIAASSPRLQAIVMGTEDLIKSIGIGRDAARTGLLFALSRCVFAAKAAGLSIIDGVYTSLNDEGGFTAACTQGSLLGFDGKAVIHPVQIGPANIAFGSL